MLSLLAPHETPDYSDREQQLRQQLFSKRDVVVALQSLGPALCAVADAFAQLSTHSPTQASLKAGVDCVTAAAMITEERRVQAAEAFVATTFPNATLRERQGALLHYELPRGANDLASMFGLMERAVAASAGADDADDGDDGNGAASAGDQLYIDNYSLGQTSLEQIFNSFASQQEEDEQK